MGEIRKHHAVKLIVGFIFKEEPVYTKTKTFLEKKFGKIDFESKTLTFNYTRYYEKEFGKDLLRKFICFKKLIPPEKLPQIKHASSGIEQKFLSERRRRINIDPGYLDLAKLILATTKDYKHRIYLDKGIFAEITLFYQGNSFRSWDWTYPDYQTDEYIQIFNHIRQLYAHQIQGNVP